MQILSLLFLHFFRGFLRLTFLGVLFYIPKFAKIYPFYAYIEYLVKYFIFGWDK